jgi:large subunit ribosomal protein L4
VNYNLLHQAVVRYEANQRLGTAKTKTVAEVVGHKVKPFKQKGTGRARMGKVRRFGSRKGGTCFGPIPRDYSLDMPKKQRRAALKSALLGKLKDGEVKVLDKLDLSSPKTQEAAKILSALKVEKSALIAVAQYSEAAWKSIRNLPNADLLPALELNPYALIRPATVIFTKEALEAFFTFLTNEKAVE